MSCLNYLARLLSLFFGQFGKIDLFLWPVFHRIHRIICCFICCQKLSVEDKASTDILETEVDMCIVGPAVYSSRGVSKTR